MIKKILSLLTGQLEHALKCIGKVINQMPDREELKNLKQSPIFNNPFAQKKAPPTRKGTKKAANPRRNRKAKGPVHSEAKTFNKPRR